MGIFTSSFANAQCNAAYTYTINSGDTVLFNDISTYSTSVIHSWDFGNGNSGSWANPPNPVQNYYPYAGKYNVCLTISDTMPTTCNSRYCDTITITNAPNYPCNATFTVQIDTSYVRFYSNQSTFYGKKWFWNFGDGSYDNSGDYAPIHQYATPGTYIVCLTTATNMGVTCSSCDTINVIPCSQSLSVSFTQSLSGNTATFTGNCSGSLVPNPWHWSFGDGSTAYTQNATHTYQYNGTFTVCLTYNRDSMGCSKTFCDTLAITNASPYPCNAMFSYYPDTMSGNSLYFYDQSSMNIVGWNWSFPGGTPSSYNGPHTFVTYPAAEKYIAYLTVTNQSGISCSYSDTVHVGNNCTNTNAYFTMSPTATPHVWSVVNRATGTPPISYSWNWGDGSFSTGANPTHTYSQADWYNICLSITDAIACGSSYCSHDTLYKLNSTETIISVIVTSPTGINNFSFSDEFSLYPNPTSGVFLIQFGGIQWTEGNQFSLEIYNILGEKVPYHQNNNEIDITKAPNGMYFLEIRTDKGCSMMKVEKD